jgi:hypothetical protein
MKKVLSLAIAAAFASTSLLAATDAIAQTATPAPKAATAKPASGAKPAAKHVVAKRKVVRKKEVAAAKETIPADAVKWNCAEGESMYVAGDMKHDQILTVYFDHHSYKLPRETTTTGADRFYDPASTWDLVVIPTKAMLFQDGQHDRLADECKADGMVGQSAPAKKP